MDALMILTQCMRMGGMHVKHVATWDTCMNVQERVLTSFAEAVLLPLGPLKP